MHSYHALYGWFDQPINQFIPICIILYSVIYIHYDSLNTMRHKLVLAHICTCMNTCQHHNWTGINLAVQANPNLLIQKVFHKTQLSNSTSCEIRKNCTIGFHRWLISINKITFCMIVKWFYCLTRFGQNRQFGPGYRCLVHTKFEKKVIFFLATKCGSWAILVGYECTSELRVKTICRARGQGSVPLVNKYISLQSWELHISTSLGMRSCLNSGPVCALYIALHMLRTDFFCITSSWCNLYWKAEPHNNVPYERWQCIMIYYSVFILSLEGIF